MTNPNAATDKLPFQSVHVSGNAAAKEYTLPGIFSSSLEDLTGDLMEISLGTTDDAGTWVPGTDPSTLVTYNATNDAGKSTASIALLITSTTPLGDYVVWCRLTDHPEVVPRPYLRLKVK